MKESFLDYAMSVIVARAIPDVRDGMKPVHRRIVYSMSETGNTPEDINDILNKITRALTGVKETFEVKYYPFVPYDADFNENAKKAFKRAEEGDFKHKQTSIGVHREDISISLNGRDIAMISTPQFSTSTPRNSAAMLGN